MSLPRGQRSQIRKATQVVELPRGSVPPTLGEHRGPPKNRPLEPINFPIDLLLSTEEGEQGPIGTTGIPGTIGPQGPIGLQGEDAEDPIILPGSNGLQGLQGIQGIPGEDGVNGEDGFLVLNPVSTFSSVTPGATSVTGPSSPTAPNSSSAFKMQGIAGTITPVTTGNILFTAVGTFISTTTASGDGIRVRLSYGTGAAPGSNATLTGTQIGADLQATTPTTVGNATNIHTPFALTGVITGATLNTALWLDISARAVVSVNAYSISNVVLTAVEV